MRKKEQKIIANYSRDFGFPRNGGPVMNKGTSTLRCGDKGWGYWHIKARHLNDWNELAGRSDHETWMDVADAGLTKTLADPDTVTYSHKRLTYCLSARINLYRNYDYVGSEIIQTIIGKDMNIVSTYPPENKKQCEDDSHD